MGTRIVSGEEKVRKVMHEFKAGTLRSSSGQKVTKRDQAVAIAMSEARRGEARRGRKGRKKKGGKG